MNRLLKWLIRSEIVDYKEARKAGMQEKEKLLQSLQRKAWFVFSNRGKARLDKGASLRKGVIPLLGKDIGATVTEMITVLR